MCFALCIPMFVSMYGFYYNDGKLSKYYGIPENYEFIQEDNDKKIGTGFINRDTKDYMNDVVITNKMSPYFALGFFMDYYFNNIKGVSVLETYTIRGYSAAKETIDVIKNTKPRIGRSFDPFGEYYLSRWILTSGNYVFNSNDNLFYPNRNFSYEQVSQYNQMAPIGWDGMDARNYSNMLGLSMRTLMPILIKTSLNHSMYIEDGSLIIVFDGALNGNYADLFYIEFADMDKNYQLATYDGEGLYIVGEKSPLSKYFLRRIYNNNMQVNIEWSDNEGNVHNMITNMGKGKLLIPLGSGYHWLLNNHSYLRITVLSDGEKIELPRVNKFEFYKLREID